MVRQATDARAVIDANNARFEEALGRGDAAAVAGLYAEDATLLPPDTSAVTGRAAIEEFWKASIQMGVRGAALETVQFEERQDLAFEVGRFRLRLEPNGAEPSSLVGKYVVLHRRQADGHWKVAVDIYNTDGPASDGAEA